MHLTRPKSSKGRSRPAVNTTSNTGESNSAQRLTASPDCPVQSRPEGHLRSQSQPVMYQTSQLSQDEVLQMLHHVPAAPPQSLNKYKVLPSIKKGQPGESPRQSLEKQLSQLSLGDDAILMHRHRPTEEPDLEAAVSENFNSEQATRADVQHRVWPTPPDLVQAVITDGITSGSLLLAIRAPCGRRFQQHFEPTDTLAKVRASAEAKYGTEYASVSIETLEVPRRIFTDMERTLAQCSVVNRSVLCILQHDNATEHE